MPDFPLLCTVDLKVLFATKTGGPALLYYNNEYTAHAKKVGYSQKVLKSTIWHSDFSAYLLTMLWFEQHGSDYWIEDSTVTGSYPLLYGVYCYHDDIMMFELYKATWNHETEVNCYRNNRA